MKKSHLHPIPRFLLKAIFGMLAATSCEDDHKQRILPAVIQFTANVQNVTEGEEATIALALDKPARANVSVELSVETNAVYNQHFQTDPSMSNDVIVLQIEKGQNSAAFKVTTTDNDKYEGARFIIFQIKPQSDDLVLGDTAALTLIIADGEGPSLANFKGSAGRLNEAAADGVLVEIPFSTSASAEGSLTVTVQGGNAIIGTNFTIDQEVTDNSFSLNVARNTASVRFKVFPIDNNVFTGDFTLSFAITETSGVVQKGNSTKFALLLEDDEAPAVARFASLAGTVEETKEDGINVGILLSSPVKGEGSLAITFPTGNLVYGTDFTTLPEAKNGRITLDFSYDQVSADFTVFPLNNDLLTEDRRLAFSIAQASGVVWKDSDSLVYELTFVDDEEASVASFATTAATVDETSTEGIEVAIQFSHPAGATGRIIVTVEGFPDNFVSEPAVEIIRYYQSYYSYSSGYDTYQIVLEISQGAPGASFRIFPKNDTRCSAGEVTHFTITGVSGAIRKENLPRFDLTIADDEVPMLVALSQTEGTLNENDASGKEIVLNFSPPAPRDGALLLTLNYYNNYHSGRYTSIPKMVYSSTNGDHAVLNFKRGDTDVRLKVLPVNDQLENGDFREPFHPSPYQGQSDYGCVKIVDRTYTLIFLDDD